MSLIFFPYFFLDQIIIEQHNLQLPCICGLSLVFAAIEDHPLYSDLIGGKGLYKTFYIS